LAASGAAQSAILFYDGTETLSNNIPHNLVHPNAVTNLAGYICWGAHSSLGSTYPVDGNLHWSGNSAWWLIETLESFNGQQLGGQGNFTEWFSANAFEGSNYSNTPVGAVSHLEEPGLNGVEDGSVYFGFWQSGKNFAICAWTSRKTPYFQAIGDPLIVR
jgi:hypothetical protein